MRWMRTLDLRLNVKRIVVYFCNAGHWFVYFYINGKRNDRSGKRSVPFSTSWTSYQLVHHYDVSVRERCKCFAGGLVSLFGQKHPASYKHTVVFVLGLYLVWSFNDVLISLAWMCHARVCRLRVKLCVLCLCVLASETFVPDVTESRKRSTEVKELLCCVCLCVFVGVCYKPIAFSRLSWITC